MLVAVRRRVALGSPSLPALRAASLLAQRHRNLLCSRGMRLRSNSLPLILIRRRLRLLRLLLRHFVGLIKEDVRFPFAHVGTCGALKRAQPPGSSLNPEPRTRTRPSLEHQHPYQYGIRRDSRQ